MPIEKTWIKQTLGATFQVSEEEWRSADQDQVIHPYNFLKNIQNYTLLTKKLFVL